MTSITKNDNSGPQKYSIEKKKMLNRFYFPPTLRIPPTFFCGAGPENQHMTSITKTTTPAHTKYSIEKKMLNRFYFPPTLPHSTHIRLWCRAGNPTQDLYQQERQLRPSQNMQKKKDVKSILFPIYPPAFHPHSFVAQDRITNT
ncbi:hypothetical protein TNCV_456631 [Trichonephila clavipes]|uniref:Uncharacterized protein n=1 Tax=Trichonephila clavipes TaxID=2585209 RepID=A0A8X6V9B4_TRICX|nr:hypothetical protein TNCV_456631 [Trichonephila clavipes]